MMRRTIALSRWSLKAELASVGLRGLGCTPARASFRRCQRWCERANGDVHGSTQPIIHHETKALSWHLAVNGNRLN
jgi:hypothetical protein